MDVTPGYKQTEVGVIPEEWGLKPLSELFAFSGGYTASRAQLSDAGHCYLHYGDIHAATKTTIDTTSDQQDIPRLSVSLEDVSPKSLLKDGDVVFVDASEDDEGASKHVVVVNRSDVPFISGLHTIVAKSLTDELSKQYRRYCFQTRAIRQQFLYYAVGTKVKGISKTNIAKLWLPVPPNLEQRAIAAALSDVDALLGGLERLLVKKRDLKQATMQQLLTGQTRLPGFSGEWEEMRLGDVATFHKGKGLPKSALSPYGAEPCVHYGELFTQYGETISDTISRTNRSAGTFRSVANDVLMPTSDVTPRGLAKASCVVADGVVLGGDILVIRTEPKVISGTFLSHVIRREDEQVLSLVSGTTVFHLYGADMKKFTCKLPRLVEQLAIVAVLSDSQAELAAVEACRDKTRDLKQAMMQELLTGKTRLVPAGGARD